MRVGHETNSLYFERPTKLQVNMQIFGVPVAGTFDSTFETLPSI